MGGFVNSVLFISVKNMSHQTGIQANEELKAVFAKAREGKIRVIKVDIQDEQLICANKQEVVGDWESDYDNAILPLLEEKDPCFLFYRLDSKNNQGYEWLFISYSPDFSKPQRKMLFAGSKATLRKEFGGGHIKEEIFGTVQGDVSLLGFKRHKAHESAPPPLTDQEKELELVKQQEMRTDISVDTKQSHMTGVRFPVNESALAKLRELKNKKISLVQLELNTQNETIVLADAQAAVSADDLNKHVPGDKGRYIFYLFKHTFEGDYMESIMFVYSMPGYKCSIKDRMLYSTCKGPLLDVAADRIGMTIARKIEISEPSELNEQFLMEELHPRKDLVRQKFAKPPKPTGSRGPRRINNSPTDSSN